MHNILQGKFHSFHPVATILSYLTKAPLVSLFLPQKLKVVYVFHVHLEVINQV